MLSGSTILRISLLLVVAGCLAALVQYFLPHAAPIADAPAPASAIPAPAPRKVGIPAPPQPSAAAPRAPVATQVPSSATPPATSSVPPPSPQPPVEAPVAASPRALPEARPAAPEPVSPQPAQPAGQAEVDAAGDSAGPRALALVDLNTASLADLNGLRGGGSIGRAIIQRRPYTAIDQLLSKRVLSRGTYDKIKEQVTVR